MQEQQQKQQRLTPRWKEWVPLFSQQRRLRHLIQVLLLNVPPGRPVYYTFHLTPMSAPFYTSEALEGEQLHWAEMEEKQFEGINMAVEGIVLRLWRCGDSECTDSLMFVWGVHFSGLAYLGIRSLTDPSSFPSNTLVFHLHGGYFTPKVGEEPNTRLCSAGFPACDVRPSYSPQLLLRLHRIQLAMRQQEKAAELLRLRIQAKGVGTEVTETVVANTQRLGKSRRRPIPFATVMKFRRDIEAIKLRVRLLREEKENKNQNLQLLKKSLETNVEAVKDKGSEIVDNYQTLHNELDRLRDWKRAFNEVREQYLHITSQLVFRRRELINELILIYPITMDSNGQFLICNVHLPNSEEFAHHDETRISVSLGFVAHVVQMISYFLQVPLRYPLKHIGSRSRIVDLILDKIPDAEREFPLFSKGKDKLQFNYGVYLLNKDIAQLRWYCGMLTQDLRATLANLAGMLQMKNGPIPGFSLSSGQIERLPTCRRPSMSSVEHLTPPFSKGHRTTRSMGSSELRFSPQLRGSIISQNALSYSLDAGLDEFSSMPHLGENVGGQIGSEPTLSGGQAVEGVEVKNETVSSGDEMHQVNYIQNWQASLPVSQEVCSETSTSEDEGVKSAVLLHSSSKELNMPLSEIEAKASNPVSVCDIVCEKGESLKIFEEENGSNELLCSEKSGTLESVCSDVIETTEEPSDTESSSSCVMSPLLKPSEVVLSEPKNSEPPENGEVQNWLSCSNQDSNFFLKASPPDLDTEVVDSLLANVARRTEALSNRVTSFNLVRSRQNAAEDGVS